MAIKTDALQQNNAPKLTDTLLMASSAAGTTQLSLAQAAAFFGTELAQAGNPVGTALSNKAAKSVQDTVEMAAVSTRTVEVAAAELPNYINSLPRLLTEELTITVLGGAAAKTITLRYFYGAGTLTIKAAEGAQVQIGRINAYYNHAMLNLNGLKLQKANEVLLDVYQSDLRLTNCSFLGSGGKPAGITAYAMSRISAKTCTFQNLSTAVLAGETSIAAVTNCAGAGNNIGVNAWNGGIIMLSGSTPDLVGGAANTKAGGIIVNKNDELI